VLGLGFVRQIETPSWHRTDMRAITCENHILWCHNEGNLITVEATWLLFIAEFLRDEQL